MDEVSKSTLASRHRANRQEALREELSAKQHIGRLCKMLDEEWITPVLNEDGIPMVFAGRVLTINRVQEIKGKADIMLKLLNKTLPDLKSIEHSGSISDKPIEELTDEDIAGELVALRSALNGNAAKASRKKKPH